MIQAIVMAFGQTRLGPRVLALALVTAGLLSGGCGGDGSKPAPAVARADTAAALGRCSDRPGVSSARCGTVKVPLDRENPGAGTTTVAFALVPRRNGSVPSAGTLVFNPGGPGEPTMGHAADTAKMFAPLLDKRDLLLIDPRGTGRSTPLECRAADRQRLADLFASAARTLEAIGACGRELGPRARFYGSAAVADDFDAVRAALGLDRLDLWGNSYGTYLMPVYTARHPQHVRSMYLSAAYPIDFDPWASTASMPRAGASASPALAPAAVMAMRCYAISPLSPRDCVVDP